MNSAETRAQVLYNAILISILILYGLFGAYVFRTLETQNVASLENSQPEISSEELLTSYGIKITWVLMTGRQK